MLSQNSLWKSSPHIVVPVTPYA
ncbi:hypothetical protein WKA_04520, partial [Escherichia coli KTE153]